MEPAANDFRRLVVWNKKKKAQEHKNSMQSQRWLEPLEGSQK